MNMSGRFVMGLMVALLINGSANWEFGNFNLR